MLELDPKLAPTSVNNFVALARQGFYDNVTFHRVVPGFVIQGGDPEGSGRGGPGYRFADEPVKGEYTLGAVAMANAGPDTNGSQFFICIDDCTRKLDKAYNLFGYVTSGLEVTQADRPGRRHALGDGGREARHADRPSRSSRCGSRRRARITNLVQMSEEPLFMPRGADFVPSEHTRGPWDPRHQHGGAVAALAARAVERRAGPEFCLTRLTVELMRPVPLEPLAVDVAVPRPGRRVLGITVSLSAGDLEVEVVRAHAVAVRRTDLPTGEGHDSPTSSPVPASGVVLPFGFSDDDAARLPPHRHGGALRRRRGRPARPGHAPGSGCAARWSATRSRRACSGRRPPPTSATACRGCCPFDDWIFLNPDLTLHLARDAARRVDRARRHAPLPSDQGMALAESRGATTSGAPRPGGAEPAAAAARPGERAPRADGQHGAVSARRRRLRRAARAATAPACRPNGAPVSRRPR